MRRLFRSFERSGVDYLLISGQASVLYGAATFSEDIDLWVRPSPGNAQRLLRGLAACGARVHKLTPPLTMRNLRAGHGFHFLIPDPPGPVYLDVMARPPRSCSFAAARRRASVMATDWGRVPVVSIQDLIPLKMTRRLSDYEIISNLVQARVSAEPNPGRLLLLWAARHSFNAEHRVAFLAKLGIRKQVEPCREEIAREVAHLQARDVRYWRRHIAELRRLRRTGGLLAEGTPVAALTRPLIRRA